MDSSLKWQISGDPRSKTPAFKSVLLAVIAGCSGFRCSANTVDDFQGQSILNMKILRLLADGKPHSGEALGAALGISRTAVWKQLAAWRGRGLNIAAILGKGYCLIPALECWSAGAITENMSAAARPLLQELILLDQTGSTNDVVLARMATGAAAGVVCIAEEQTAGRGRRGRTWLSPVGGSFYGSIGWRFESLAVLAGLSLAVGVALARALHRYGLDTVTLKWPNDLVVNGAKLGGVLVELQAEATGPCQVVIGVGLNLALPADAAIQLQRPVTDVAQHTAFPLQRNRLGALLLDELLRMLESYPAMGFAGVRKEWLDLDCMRDKAVRITGGLQELEGVARGVDVEGALCLQTDEGMLSIHAGEVSLREAVA